MDNRNTLEVHNYTRILNYATPSIEYECLVWPRKRTAYEVGHAVFKYPVSAMMTLHLGPTDNLCMQNRTYDFNYLDRLISGAEDQLTEALRYWRTRFILIPSDKHSASVQGSFGESFNEQEIYITGATRLLELISRYRWKGSSDNTNTAPLKLLPTWLAPSACVTDALLMQELDNLHKTDVNKPERQAEITQCTATNIATAMRDSANGLPIDDRWWHKTLYSDSFQGDKFVTWLLNFYSDIKTREAAVEWGRKLLDQGLIEHCTGRHGFLDGYYFYRLTPKYQSKSHHKKGLGWFTQPTAASTSASATKADLQRARTSSSPPKPYGLTFAGTGKPKRKRKVKMSQTTILDLDLQCRSDRAEVVILHSDIIHNPNNA